MRDGDLVLCDIVGCEFKRVGEKQTRMCELRLRTPEDEEITAAIWLSEKAAGIARAQFKKCGFLIDDAPLSSLPEWIAKTNPKVEVVIESYEIRDAVLYRGVIETGANRLGREDLDEATRWMRNSKKRDGDGEKDAPPQRRAPERSMEGGRQPPPARRAKSDDVNFDDIPF